MIYCSARIHALVIWTHFCWECARYVLTKYQRYFWAMYVMSYLFVYLLSVVLSWQEHNCPIKLILMCLHWSDCSLLLWFAQVVPVEPGKAPKAEWAGLWHLAVLETSEEGKHVAFQQTTKRKEVLGLHWTDRGLLPVQWVASDSVDWITWHGACSEPEFSFLNTIRPTLLFEIMQRILFSGHLVTRLERYKKDHCYWY